MRFANLLRLCVGGEKVRMNAGSPLDLHRMVSEQPGNVPYNFLVARLSVLPSLPGMRGQIVQFPIVFLGVVESNRLATN